MIITSFLVTQVRARANRWLAGKIETHKLQTNCFMYRDLFSLEYVFAKKFYEGV